MSDRLIKVSESLSVEVTESHLRIVRKAGGLVHVRKDEIACLINALAAGDLELEQGAMTAGDFDESPIAGDPDVSGKPDDFYDRGDDIHPDVW
jgi:hypothetical protein